MLRPAECVRPAYVTIIEFTNESGILQLHSAQKVYVTVLCLTAAILYMGLAIES